MGDPWRGETRSSDVKQSVELIKGLVVNIERVTHFDTAAKPAKKTNFMPVSEVVSTALLGTNQRSRALTSDTAVNCQHSLAIHAHSS
jgi:hypothetical protein